ncbi:endonuclease V [Streptomyces zagrosensis]|uniref:Endonuclease V n=1 Tax=Streptomyces zagrosensis TaxID=1042984 RepID=A0A7W9V0Z9_9ACTN|nr:endonuclease V [Streptomyces zagrosensis]MBB5937274.1 deoxyribonuclease V [Streptomyces zagrosensis]
MSPSPESPCPPVADVPADWPTTEAEATAVQEMLRGRVTQSSAAVEPGAPGVVVGVDVAYDDARDLVAAAAVAIDLHSLVVVEATTAVGRISFPYVPGLLAFREIPTVLTALGRLSRTPDLVVCDGYGLAHPRRFGLASHLGVLTGLPAIGVAKNPFAFRYAPPGERRGDSSPLWDGDEEVGRAVRTQPGVKPVFVSVGHRMTLDAACAHTLLLSPRFRLPETTRAADGACRRALAALAAGS